MQSSVHLAEGVMRKLGWVWMEDKVASRTREAGRQARSKHEHMEL